MSRAAHAPGPLPNTYWVLPGQLLAGEHPAGRSPDETRAHLATLRRAGIDCFVDLTAPSEHANYEPELPADVEYIRNPIRDHGLPERREHMVAILHSIEQALRAGRRLYVHCRAGIGRTGMVMACLLIERGLTPDDALYELNLLWQGCARSRDWAYVPETDEQIEYVRAWKASRNPHPPAAPSPPPRGGEGRVRVASRDRFLGALVGLAVGDALAAGTRDRAVGNLEPVTGYSRGEADDLPAGAWSDDTAVALCLAESLLECDGFDAHDQVLRYGRWRDSGHLSSTGRAVGVRAGTARALAVAHWRRQVFSGSHDPDQLDPEPLARVAPAILFFFGSPEEAARQARDAARTTCQAPLVLEACGLAGALLHASLEGRSKPEILAAGAQHAADHGYRDRIRELVRAGRYNEKTPTRPVGDSAFEVLEAALWAFEQARRFEDGALRAVNLGGASDVVGALYGQLAGAHFGAAAIPSAWRNGLIRKDLIEGFAERLFERAAVGRGS